MGYSKAIDTNSWVRHPHYARCMWSSNTSSHVFINLTGNAVQVRCDICGAVHETRTSYYALKETHAEFFQEPERLYCQCTDALFTGGRANCAIMTEGKVTLLAKGAVKYKIASNCNLLHPGSKPPMESCIVFDVIMWSHGNLISKQWHNLKKAGRSGNSKFCNIRCANIYSSQLHLLSMS